MVDDRICKVDGCDRVVQARQLCLTHYKRWRKNGDTGGPIITGRRQRQRMVRPECLVDGCTTVSVQAGRCSMHLIRWYRYRSTEAKVPRGTPIERILRRVTKPDGEYGCWLCSLSVNPAGYSTIAIWSDEGKRYSRRSHRIVFKHFRGPIPAGLVIDHLCRVRNCVNPAHLEAVTAAENIARGESPSQQVRRSGICRRGHEMTPDNVYVHRSCRTCSSLGSRRRKRVA